MFVRKFVAPTAAAIALAVGSASTVAVIPPTVAIAQEADGVNAPSPIDAALNSSKQVESAFGSAQDTSSAFGLNFWEILYKILDFFGLAKYFENFPFFALPGWKNPDRETRYIPKAETVSEGLVVTLIGDLLGPGVKYIMGLGAADLGMMAPLNDDGEFAIIFGDSFTGGKFGEGQWFSPTGMVGEKDSSGTIRVTRPLNDGIRAQPLIGYYSNIDMTTFIPSDVINLDGTLYMQGMWNKGLGNVTGTEIWKSTDNGKTWESVWKGDQFHLKGMGNLLSWEKGPDGYIYVVSSQFKRQDPVYLSRFRPWNIDDRDLWESYDPKTKTWGSKATPILRSYVKAGEMNLRYIQGHWVLAMFNEGTASIEVRVSKEIATNWDSIKPAHVVVAGRGGWYAPQNAHNFTQLYGGYIVPGSTLDNLDLVVSQWNTGDNSRYMSTQFNVKGLDKFFGIESAPVSHTTVGNQDVIEVAAENVTPRD